MHTAISQREHLIAQYENRGEKRLTVNVAERSLFLFEAERQSINFLSQLKQFLRWQIECGSINTEACLRGKFTSCKLLACCSRC